jgi:hypothetical protein
VGGLVGLGVESRLDGVYSTGGVEGGDQATVGGIAGELSAWCELVEAWSRSDVRGGFRAVAGGGVGKLDRGWVDQCHAFGRIAPTNGPIQAGGLISVDSSTVVESCYWNTETTGMATSAGGPGAMPRTTAQMTLPFSSDTYVGWDFDTVWEAGSDPHPNNGYPYHKWQTRLHTVTYEPSQGGSITGAASQVRIPGASTAAVTAVPADGHRFVQWSDGRTDNPRVDRNVTADMALTAVFAPITSQWILH